MRVPMRYGRSHGGQFHLVGTVGHNAVTMVQAVQDLHTLATPTTDAHLALLELLDTKLHIHVVESLLLGEGTHGYRHHPTL